MKFNDTTEYRKWDEVYLRYVFERGDGHLQAASKADLYIESLRERSDELLASYAKAVRDDTDD